MIKKEVLVLTNDCYFHLNNLNKYEDWFKT